MKPVFLLVALIFFASLNSFAAATCNITYENGALLSNVQLNMSEDTAIMIFKRDGQILNHLQPMDYLYPKNLGNLKDAAYLSIGKQDPKSDRINVYAGGFNASKKGGFETAHTSSLIMSFANWDIDVDYFLNYGPIRLIVKCQN